MGLGGNHVSHPFKVLNEANEEIEKLYNERENSKKIVDSLNDQLSYFKEEKKEIQNFTKRLIEFEDEKLRELQKNTELVQEMTQTEIGNFDKIEVAVKLNLLSNETYWKYRKYFLKNIIQQFEKELDNEITYIQFSRNVDSYYSYDRRDKYFGSESIICDQDVIFAGFSFGLGNCLKYIGKVVLKDPENNILSTLDLGKINISHENFTILKWNEPIILKKNVKYRWTVEFSEQLYYHCYYEFGKGPFKTQNGLSFTFGSENSQFRDICLISI
jgi:hypothetical protein